MNKVKLYLTTILCATFSFFMTGCTEDPAMVNLGIDDTYYIYRMQKLGLHSEFTGEEYKWTLHLPDGRDSLLSTQRDYIFLAKDEGKYKITFEVIDPNTPYHHDFEVNVMHEEVEYSRYISHVYEYMPAPGQFVNYIPEYLNGDNAETMRIRAEESITGKNDVLVSLGGFGGYIIFGFDHTVVNVPGALDFYIQGNAFYELIEPEKKGGSCEPGIVMVSYDTNMNGKPDDEWYELAGSEYYKPTTIHNYSITYTRPDPNKKPVKDDSGFLTDLTYVPWTDSEGKSGYIAKNSFHTQPYFPQWVANDQLTFTGTRLPNNAVDKSGQGRYYVLYSYEWGYVDNHPAEFKDLSSFDISWAVDKNGKPVHLPGIDFVKVYTAVNQYCGWIGETSTEICRGEDLHIKEPNGVPDDPIPGN